MRETTIVTFDLVETLRRFVATPSVNPMGRGLSGPEFGETGMTDLLEATFRQLGLRYERHTVEPGRDNIVARLDGETSPENGGGLILLAAHQDTVPVDGMTIEPWTPAIREGRLYGRGSCDVKGGMVAMVGAMARLADERPAGMPTAVMACTVNEEYGFSGARALAELCLRPGAIIPRRPDAAVVAEPTGLKVVVAHKGVVRWRCHTRGRAAHSAQPQTGDNAIYKMARVLVAIERYAREVLGTRPGHRRCGPGTVSVGTIAGGSSVNTVPDRCTIEIDRRFPPGEEPDEAYRCLIDYLSHDPDAGLPLDHDPPYMQGLALTDENNGPLADRLSAVVREVAGDCSDVGVPYATDAAFLAGAGVPTVVFGPGFIEQAHTDDEWLPLDQLEQAAEIYYRFVKLPELRSP